MDEYRLKIETELDKPENQQNLDKLTFWREHLGKLEDRVGKCNHIIFNLVYHLVFKYEC